MRTGALVLVLLAVYLGQVNSVTCNAGGRVGNCLDKNQVDCNGGNWYAGQCPGAANIQCCVQSCSNGQGTCSDTSLSCSGTWASGLCDGPANVKCCIRGSTPTPSTPTPSTPPSTPPTRSNRWLTRAANYTVQNLDRTGVRITWGTHSRPVTKFLLHTVEGRWPRNGDWGQATQTLDGSRYWPHFLVAKDDSGVVRIGQYLPLDYSGRALKWGNRDGVIQVEIGGKAASPFTTHDAALTHAVSSLYQALSLAIPTLPYKHCDSRVRWIGDAAYGEAGAARLTESQWFDVKGLVGHQHVPSNSHWDPGAINCAAL